MDDGVFIELTGMVRVVTDPIFSEKHVSEDEGIGSYVGDETTIGGGNCEMGHFYAVGLVGVDDQTDVFDRIDVVILNYFYFFLFFLVHLNVLLLLHSPPGRTKPLPSPP